MVKRWQVILVTCLFLILAVVLLVYKIKRQSNLSFIVKGYPLQITRVLLLGEDYRLVTLRHPFRPGEVLALIDNGDNLIKWLPGGGDVLIEDEFPWHGYNFKGVSLESLSPNSRGTEISVWFGSAGTAGNRPFYIYRLKKGRSVELILKLVNDSSTTDITDLDDNGVKEIVHEYSLSGIGALERSLLRWIDIYNIEETGTVKVNNRFPEQYKQLLSVYNEARKVPDANFYLSVIDCLEYQAVSNVQGNFAEAETCKDVYSNLPRFHNL